MIVFFWEVVLLLNNEMSSGRNHRLCLSGKWIKKQKRVKVFELSVFSVNSACLQPLQCFASVSNVILYLDLAKTIIFRSPMKYSCLFYSVACLLLELFPLFCSCTFVACLDTICNRWQTKDYYSIKVFLGDWHVSLARNRFNAVRHLNVDWGLLKGCRGFFDIAGK